MTKQIETHTLREWLDAHQPVTVLDIRTDDDRLQWAIPGSLHVNAYEALQNGQPGALADLVIPADPAAGVPAKDAAPLPLSVKDTPAGREPVRVKAAGA